MKLVVRFVLLLSAYCAVIDSIEVTNQRPSISDDGPINWNQRAAALVTTLNTNWYSSDLRQWTKLNGDPLGVWHTWNGLEAMIDYSNYSGDSNFDKMSFDVAGNFVLLAQAMSYYDDDALWAGIALVKAYRKSPSVFYITGAKGVFDELVGYWDSKCNGGVWWSHEKTYKNAITNELFLMLAIDLYEETGDVNYYNWAIREYNWFLASGMLNSDNLINDGLTDQCVTNNGTTWTYNQGVILGGLAGLARINPGNASTYLNLADKIVRAVAAHLTMNSSEGKAILKESVVDGEDGEQFKGIFMRYLAQLIAVTTDASRKAAYAQLILDSADYVWNNAKNNQNEVSAVWIGQRHDPPWYDAIAQISAIDLMNAAIYASKSMPQF
uniref:Glycoside hydrolase family 76 protein n=1 Tax=Plectus sambesii TaxID=2011161 RepID=A0A914XTJ0_9BILA